MVQTKLHRNRFLHSGSRFRHLPRIQVLQMVHQKGSATSRHRTQPSQQTGANGIP
jgi:hypothetical protein